MCRDQAFAPVKGMTYRNPSAATSRRFYLAFEVVSSTPMGLAVGENEWEDYLQFYGHAQLKRGEVSNPVWNLG